jgi:hypothetical protein
MGTGRGHAGHKKTTDKKRKHGRTRGTRAERRTLRGILPKAGMIYPFDRALLRTKRGDITIYSVLQKSENVRLLDGAILDTAFSRIFEEATKLQQEASGSEQFAHQPIDFIRALQLRTVSNPPSSCLAFRWFLRGRSSDFVTSLFQRSDLARSN